jgi:hypothetical protein
MAMAACLSILALATSCSLVSGGRNPTLTASPDLSVQDTLETQGGFTPTATKPLAFSPVSTPTVAATQSAAAQPLEILSAGFVQEYGRISLLGKIRNNTDSPVYFCGEDLGLHIRFSEWRMLNQWEYERLILDPVVPILTSSASQFVNCFLYPGETGVLAVKLECESENGCNEIRETSLNPPPALEMVWEYSSQPHPFPEEPPAPGLHLSAQDFQYTIKEDILFFHFTVEVTDLESGYINYRLLLEDGDGMPLNVLAGDTYFDSRRGESLEIISWVSPNGYDGWRVNGDAANSIVPLTGEIMNRLEQIEVFVEYEINQCRTSY